MMIVTHVERFCRPIVRTINFILKYWHRFFQQMFRLYHEKGHNQVYLLNYMTSNLSFR